MGRFGTQPNTDALQDLGEGLLVKDSALRSRTASPGGLTDAWLMVHDESSQRLWTDRACEHHFGYICMSFYNWKEPPHGLTLTTSWILYQMLVRASLGT